MSCERTLKRPRLDEPVSVTATENSSEGMFRPFSDLPNEIVFVILDRLDILSKVRSRRVCKKWNAFLREDYLLRLVQFDDKSALKLYESNGDGFTRKQCEHLLTKLEEVGVWKKVRHLIFDGHYDVHNQEVHRGWSPHAESKLLSELIFLMGGGQRRRKRTQEFKNLETFEVRKSAVEVGSFYDFTKATALKCKFTITDGSLVVRVSNYANKEFHHYGIEFEVHGSMTFNLSGAMVNALWLDIIDIRLPVEIEKFITEQYNAVPAETVSQFGVLFSVLLKGRPGMRIRQEVFAIFNQICYDEDEPIDGYDPKRSHWEQCMNYDFENLDNLIKYALVYYTRPRNFYKLPVAASMEEVSE